jgi:hypothetical protein
MRGRFLWEVVVAGLVVCVSGAGRKDARAGVGEWKLDRLDRLEIVNAKADVAEYQGRRAVRLRPLAGHLARDEEVMVLLTGTDFRDGTIEVDVAGKPAEGAAVTARGFIGVAFRIQPRVEKFECFYIRPTNGRADDQLRRNHSTQYISYPEYPWERLRKETPGMYESYADLETGAWTKLKIVVAGTNAQLYVNGAEQPALMVNDLKLGEGHGQIGLWSTSETEGYYSNLVVK